MTDYNYTISQTGSVGTDLNFIGDGSTVRTLKQVVVNCPAGADDDATLVISHNGVNLFNGYLYNRDANGIINIIGNRGGTGTFTVAVTGGTGDLLAEIRYN